MCHSNSYYVPLRCSEGDKCCTLRPVTVGVTSRLPDTLNVLIRLSDSPKLYVTNEGSIANNASFKLVFQRVDVPRAANAASANVVEQTELCVVTYWFNKDMVRLINSPPDDLNDMTVSY